MYEEQYGENAYRCYGLKGESVFETFVLLIFFCSEQEEWCWMMELFLQFFRLPLMARTGVVFLKFTAEMPYTDLLLLDSLKTSG